MLRKSQKSAAGTTINIQTIKLPILISESSSGFGTGSWQNKEKKSDEKKKRMRYGKTRGRSLDNFGRNKVSARIYQYKKSSISQASIFPKLWEEDNIGSNKSFNSESNTSDYNSPSDSE